MKQLRVLIVEDQLLIAMALTGLLLEMGHEVCATASTQAEALLAVSRCEPDLMIVDVSLGGESGISTVEQILQRKEVKCLFMTGDPGIVRSVRNGTIVLAKPFGPDELAAAIERVVQS